MRWWRSERGQKFLREVGSVVLGVVIALGLGAVATEIGWRIEVFRAHRALAEEMGEIMGQARERERAESCYLRRLDTLSVIVDRAAASGRLPPVGSPGSPLMRTWSRGVWNSVLGDTASHFSRADLDNLSGAYEFVDLLARHSERELELWSELYTIVGPGRAIDTEEAADLRRAISAARLESNLVTLAAVRLQQIVRAFDLGYSRDAARPYAEQPLSQVPFCRPFGPVPPRYGRAPLDGAGDRARATPITRDDAGLPAR
ncbi:hypothetical protein SAMN06297144_2679 [Sphingomonas guangdongensis]|uniref:Uncharacterized protein n=1 Tax=Sphingomonas guangdongensis TaxID=1141890 RepID=A0A285R5C7_9SPHN|nr:hypothetical protein [Sphingomonas guangdongensis]SOB87547.1 hypothetical protein SAMN06297144_2679 [Sphingomonas guangdongensis]